MRACLATLLSLLTPTALLADEGGVSFWAPGQFGSFSATPSEPGFAVPVVYYHATADAGRSKNFLVGGNLTLVAAAPAQHSVTSSRACRLSARRSVTSSRSARKKGT